MAEILWTKEVEDDIRADEREKAEADFQNSDYWSDYIERVKGLVTIQAYEEFAERIKKNAVPIMFRNTGVYCKGVGTKEIDKVCEVMQNFVRERMNK